MKKATIIKMISLAFTVLILVSVLASCGGLSGKYKNDMLGMTVEFKSGNKVVYSYENFLTGEIETVNGTYKIDGDKIIFTMEEEDCDIEGENQFEKGTDYIKIDGLTFTK